MRWKGEDHTNIYLYYGSLLWGVCFQEAEGGRLNKRWAAADPMDLCSMMRTWPGGAAALKLKVEMVYSGFLFLCYSFTSALSLSLDLWKSICFTLVNSAIWFPPSPGITTSDPDQSPLANSMYKSMVSFNMLVFSTNSWSHLCSCC